MKDYEVYSYNKLIGELKESSTYSKKFLEFCSGKGEIFRKNKNNSKYYINSFFPSINSLSFERLLLAHEKIKTNNERSLINADVCITGRCTCKCWHCFRGEADSEQLTIQTLERCFKELYDLGVSTIGITGGEAMMREDIKEIIDLLPNGVEGQLYTTGFRVDSEFAKYLKETQVTRVIISLDHYLQKEVIFSRRNKNAWKDAMTAINALVLEGIYTAVTVCVTEKLLVENEIDKYLEFVQKLGIQEVRVILPIPQGKIEGKSNIRAHLDAVKLMRKKKEEFSGEINFPTIVNFFDLEGSDYLGCGAGYNYISINNDGNITPCVAVPLSFGNVNEESLSNIYSKMGHYFLSPGKTCYGKIAATYMKNEGISSKGDILSESVSQKIAEKCKRNQEMSSIFKCNCR